MKTVVPIGSAEPAPPVTVDLVAPRLRPPALRVKQRVLINEALQNEALIHRRVRVKGDAEQRTARRQPLQNVHVVGHTGAGLLLRAQPVIPARPGARPHRQPARVAVQHHLVALPTDIAQHLALCGGRVVKHRQSTAGVAGKYHLVEGMAAVFKLERDPVLVAAHPLNR